jgi:hypothetical protein
MIYFGSSGFGSFGFPTPNFLRSAFARSHRSSAMCPFRSDDHDLLREFGLWEFQLPHSHFPPKCFCPKLQIKRHVLLQIGRSIFTSGIQTSGVLAPPLSLSSGAFSPEDHRSLSCVHPNLTVVVFFGTPGFGSFSFLALIFIQSVFSRS